MERHGFGALPRTGMMQGQGEETFFRVLSALILLRPPLNCANLPDSNHTAMPTCPICFQPLGTTRQREGLYYPCTSCDGRAVTLSQIRHVLGEKVARKLLRLMKLSRRR